jgi:signal transduction histidine kinase
LEKLILQRKFWIVPIAVWTAVAVVSFLWNTSFVDDLVAERAISRGRVVFKMIETMRAWNASHGGVYVPVDAATQPNPYLEVPDRDIVTTSGRRLTLINPAYMTRQLAELISTRNDMVVRLTSLKPFNPGNTPDPWEAAALQAFERGEPERQAFVRTDKGLESRYMAPLRTERTCLRCHGSQGYKVGDIRGGISVSFSAEPLFGAIRLQKWSLGFAHLGAWGALSALSLFGLSSLRRRVLSLKEAKEQQDALVDRRTAELREEVARRKLAEYRIRQSLEDERCRVAREVHDELGQVLSGLKLNIGWLDGKLTEMGSPLARKTASMGDIVDNAIDSVRTIAARLRPQMLDQLGLTAAVEWQVQEFAVQTGILCDLKMPDEDLAPEIAQSTTIFRILQEALTNVLRHAHATQVKITLRTRGNLLFLSVRDNGSGFDVSAENQSLGLLGITERALMAGGKARIKSRKDYGTKVSACVPLSLPNRRSHDR